MWFETASTVGGGEDVPVGRLRRWWRGRRRAAALVLDAMGAWKDSMTATQMLTSAWSVLKDDSCFQHKSATRVVEATIARPGKKSSNEAGSQDLASDERRVGAVRAIHRADDQRAAGQSYDSKSGLPVLLANLKSPFGPGRRRLPSRGHDSAFLARSGPRPRAISAGRPPPPARAPPAPAVAALRLLSRPRPRPCSRA